MATMLIDNADSNETAKRLLDDLFDECCATGTSAQVAERCRAVAELTEKLTGHHYEPQDVGCKTTERQR